MHRSQSEFFEDFSLDSMSNPTDSSSEDTGNYQSQTVDISEANSEGSIESSNEDTQTNSFVRTEIVESEEKDKDKN